MKKVLLLLLAIFCIASCGDVDDIANHVDNLQISHTSQSNNLGYIMQRIHISPQTRANSIICVKPYIYENDTVMFVVNYNDGWELYSNDTTVPMMLAHSASGTFDRDNREEDDPLYAFIDDIARNLHERQEMGIRNSTINGDWSAIIPNDTLPGTSFSDPHSDLYIWGAQQGSGYWDLLSADTLSTELIDNVPHLISTHWHQSNPYNKYTPIVNGIIKSLAGCVPVAIAQYLNYLAVNKNKTFVMPSSVTQPNQGGEYLFSGQSTTIWQSIASLPERITNDSIAIIIAYIGQRIHTQYMIEGSSSNYYYYRNYLQTIGLPCTRDSLDIPFVKEELLNNNPILCTASNTTGTGHMFLIDALRTKKHVIRYSYGWHQIGENGQSLNNLDESGNIIYQGGCIITKEQLSSDVQMNWGWANPQNDATWFVLASDVYWNTTSATYYYPTILKVTL